MKWNVYIARRTRPGEYESDKHTVEVPGSSRGDNAFVTWLAAKHFRAPQDKIMCIPTPAGDRGRAVATLRDSSRSDPRHRGKRARRDPAASKYIRSRAAKLGHWARKEKRKEQLRRMGYTPAQIARVMKRGY